MIDLPVVFIIQKAVLSFEYLTSETETKWKLKNEANGRLSILKDNRSTGPSIGSDRFVPSAHTSPWPSSFLHLLSVCPSVLRGLHEFTEEVWGSSESSKLMLLQQLWILHSNLFHAALFFFVSMEVECWWDGKFIFFELMISFAFTFTLNFFKLLLCLQDCFYLETDILKAFFKVQGWEDSSRPQLTSASILNREPPADTVVLLSHLSARLIIRISTFKICKIQISCSKLEGLSRQHRSRVQGWRASLECECEFVQRALSTLGSRPECSGRYVRAHRMDTSLFSQKTAANVGSLLLQHHGLLEVQHHGERLVELPREKVHIHAHSHTQAAPLHPSILSFTAVFYLHLVNRGVG